MRTVAGLLVCAIAAFPQSDTDVQMDTHLRDLAANPKSSLASFRLGEIFVRQANFQSAANHFRNALEGDRLPPWVVVWSHVNLARIFERTGQHDRAVSSYQSAVKTNDNTGGALDEAIKFLKEAGSEIPKPHIDREAVAAMHVPPGVYPVGPGVLPPVPLDSDPPEYTDEARAAELEGTVWIAAIVGRDGTARDVRVMHGIGLGLDEKAVEAVRKRRFRPGMYEGNEVDTLATFPVDFVLPAKQSRWHLIRATFRPADGASRPVVRSISYPPGAGVTKSLMDHARVIVSVGRQATATLSFEINQEGRPVSLKVESASDDRWGPEAMSIVQTWAFAPGMKDGAAVSVSCTVTLVWGQRNLGADVIRQIGERTQ